MTSDETTRRLLANAFKGVREIANRMSNIFRIFATLLDEAALNIRIKQSKDSRVKKYHQIYRRTKKPRIKKKQMKKIKAIL